ncbi:MAG: J domain-containing protein [Spirochaetaceae bacterium]|nr:MAG: J domain-containing protein [Spirochaetaceae bacterium]
MANYYEMLGLKTSCSQVEIKQAFRRKAKKLHPDVTSDRQGTLALMQQLVAAYKTLYDPETREEYDRRHRILHHEDQFDYREFLRKRRNDPQSQSELIFFDLLHDRAHDALHLYDDLMGTDGFTLAAHLDREDFMDCAFLLAEEYESRGSLLQAFRLLLKIADFEREEPYFRHFFDEVKDRLRIIVGTRMPGKVSDVVLLDCLERMIEYDFSRRDTAFYLKRAAELHAAAARLEKASVYLRRGLRLDQRLGGTKKLMELLMEGNSH